MTRRLRLIAMLIAVTMIAGVGTLAKRASSGPGTFEVTALFSKTIGLFPSSKVDVLGVSVGKVVSVTPAGNDVKVVMSINRDQRIPADARATIVPISLISDRYIQLFPPYQTGPTLAGGAVIGTDRTFIPAELDDLLGQLKKVLDALQTGPDQNTPALGALIHNLSMALAGTGANIDATLGGGGRVATTLLARSADLDKIVDHLTNIVTALAVRRNDLVALNTHLAEALGAIADERNSLGGALSNIDLLTAQLSSLVHDHRAALETDLKIVAETTKAVVDHQDSLIRTLRWLPVLDDGVEGQHNGGAIHLGGPGPIHVDVRDSHFTTCPPGVPVGLCVLLGLNGTPLSMPAAAAKTPAPASTDKAASPGSAATGSQAGADLLDLLRLLPSVAGATATPEPASSPVEDLLDRLGGALNGALGWLF